MNARINQLVKSLLQKESLDHCSLEEVEQFAERYPYFGAAQLLLTKKLQVENNSRYADQLQKTYLFFHNPLWVEQLLNETGSGSLQKNPDAAPLPVNTVPASPVIPPVEEKMTGGTSPVAEELLPEMPEPVPAPAEETATPEIAPITEQAAPIAQPAPIPAPAVEAGEQETVPTVEPPSFTPPAEEPLPITMASAETVLPQNPETEPAPFNPGMPDAVTGTDELLFEPYHTVDYFASQGIKAVEEENPRDKFTQQLKSFTGWLKTLKKLPITDITRAPVSQGEHKVEQLASHSLQEGDVVTETMAEVWEKQGNNTKAIEIYRKLSLLEPAKSVYFAAKIEELKKLY